MKFDIIGKAAVDSTIRLAEGYIVLPGNDAAVKLIQKHGIEVQRITKPQEIDIEEFLMSEVAPDRELYQGHVMVSAKGEYQPKRASIPANSYYISLKQPLGRIAAVLLEPEADNSLLRWGFFNRVLVHQWGTNRPNFCPVYRVLKYMD